jgi:hypothetical protein
MRQLVIITVFAFICAAGTASAQAMAAPGNAPPRRSSLVPVAFGASPAGWTRAAPIASREAGLASILRARGAGRHRVDASALRSDLPYAGGKTRHRRARAYAGWSRYDENGVNAGRRRMREPAGSLGAAVPGHPAGICVGGIDPLHGRRTFVR